MMRQFFVLLLVVVMPLKALASTYGVCGQETMNHGQQHEAVSVHAAHEEAAQLNGTANPSECSDCNLCHTTCGTFAVSLQGGLLLPTTPSGAVITPLSAAIKTQPSDPPYRPKWSSLA